MTDHGMPSTWAEVSRVLGMRASFACLFFSKNILRRLGRFTLPAAARRLAWVVGLWSLCMAWGTLTAWQSWSYERSFGWVKMTKLSKRKPWKKWEMKTSSWQQQHCELGKCQSRDIIRYYCATSRQLFAPLAAFTETWHLFALKLCLRFTFEFPPDEAGPELIISLAEKKNNLERKNLKLGGCRYKMESEHNTNLASQVIPPSQLKGQLGESFVFLVH